MRTRINSAVPRAVATDRTPGLPSPATTQRPASATISSSRLADDAVRNLSNKLLNRLIVDQGECEKDRANHVARRAVRAAAIGLSRGGSAANSERISAGVPI